MGQGASKASKGLRLPRSSQAATKQPTPATATREQMLAEETEKPEDTQLKEKLQYFLNPRELRTPITATDSGANRNVQALRNRSEEDEGQVARGRMQSQDVSRMLRELQGARVSDDAVQQAVQRYGLDAETVRRLAAFLHSS